MGIVKWEKSTVFEEQHQVSKSSIVNRRLSKLTSKRITSIQYQRKLNSKYYFEINIVQKQKRMLYKFQLAIIAFMWKIYFDLRLQENLIAADLLACFFAVFTNMLVKILIPSYGVVFKYVLYCGHNYRYSVRKMQLGT